MVDFSELTDISSWIFCLISGKIRKYSQPTRQAWPCSSDCLIPWRSPLLQTAGEESWHGETDSDSTVLGKKEIRRHRRRPGQVCTWLFMKAGNTIYFIQGGGEEREGFLLLLLWTDITRCSTKPACLSRHILSSRRIWGSDPCWSARNLWDGKRES